MWSKQAYEVFQVKSSDEDAVKRTRIVEFVWAERQRTDAIMLDVIEYVSAQRMSFECWDFLSPLNASHVVAQSFGRTHM